MKTSLHDLPYKIDLLPYSKWKPLTWQVFNQDKIWINARREIIPVEQISIDYANNIMRYLLRHFDMGRITETPLYKRLEQIQ